MENSITDTPSDTTPDTPVTPAAPTIDAQAIAEAVAKALATSDLFGGRRQEAPPPPQQRRPTIREQYEAWSPEQKQKFDLEVSANPGKAAIAIAEAMATEQIQGMVSQATPYMHTSGELFIENFISQKSGQDRMFSKVEPMFRKELADVDVTYLLGLPAQQRIRQLNLRWDSAASQVYRAAAASIKPDPPIIGAGGGRGGPGGKPTKAVGAIFSDAQLENEPAIRDLVIRLKSQDLLSDDDIANVEETYKDEYLGG